jgi:glycosyltransferase involved in cell wall biosynthesis
MITTFYPPYNFGGDGIFVQRLSHELALRGHHVEVIHCADAYRVLAGHEPGPAAPEHPNITVHRLSSPFGFLSPLATQQTGYPFFKAAQIRAILDKGFDVIHYHNISLVGGPGVLKLGNAIKLYTLHEFWLVCPTHILFKYNSEVCTKRDCVSCQLVHRRPPQLWRHTSMMLDAARHVDMFISPDRHTIGKHQEWWSDIPIVYHPHFVPPVALAPQDESVPPYFLFVGRLEKLKGLQNIIPLFRNYPRAQLWIAGTGLYESELRALAQDSPNIRFLGYQSGSRLQELYRQAVAVIVPSVNYEVAPPLVVMEGFRQQTPALVLNLGSMPEIIADSGGGFVYDAVADLADRMDRLCENRAFRDELGMRGYQAYQSKWTADAHLATYFSLIEDIAARRGVSLNGVGGNHVDEPAADLVKAGA